jgi:hypothetical protein
MAEALHQLLPALASRHKWLTPIVDLGNLDEFLKTVTKQYFGGTFRFDPVLYESLLSDISAALDRCLTYRREFNDLASSAIRQALEYELFFDAEGYR